MTTDNLLPPHDIGAEEAVNGSLLIDGQAIKEIDNTLKVEDFYNEANRNIYAACSGLYERDEAIDAVTVAQELDRNGKLDDTGGAAYLAHISSKVPTSLDITSYAGIVSKLATMRDVIAAARQIQKIGHAADPDVEASLSRVAEIVDGLKKGRGGHHIITPGERFSRAFERYHALSVAERGIATPTGLIDLDKALGGGLFPGTLNLLAASTGMGKSALAQTIANNAASQVNVLVCSGEMSIDDWNDRDVAGYTGRPIDDIRYGAYGDELLDEIISTALPPMGEKMLYYMAKSRRFAFTTSNVYHAAYSLQEREGLGLLVVDYLALLTDRYEGKEHHRISYLTGRSKDMATDLGVPILCLHQLNRDVNKRENKIPGLSDLREAGEQDADVVMFLDRESYHQKDSESNVAMVYIAKKRQGQGRRGKRVTLQWNETGQAYENTLSDRVEGE
ncbi:hypothetical protein LCGC14_1151800 [marine sediment metagenome]|uniref:DNA 5'-3' helicase n=2 Tax=marine sediment metagenome TaxID=412755 RepID=A0A0F9Q0T3_9ZZZZ